MGANESQVREANWREEAESRLVFNNNNTSYRKGHKKSGKPLSPPSKPLASDITHNSLVLTWNPPKHDGSILAYTVEMCHMSDNRWLVLTYSCQGCLYQVRNLQPDQIYKFRIRVENIYGPSKPSAESDPVQTHLSELDMPYRHSEDTSEQKKSKPVRRRHSFNVPLEGAVVSILNHSDTVVKASTCLKNFNNPGTQSAESTFQRGCFRTSLEPCRKRSLASLLPGTKTDSVARMRDSYRKSNTSRSSIFNMPGVNRSANNSRSDISCSAHTSHSDISVHTDISKSDLSSPDSIVDKRFSNSSDSQTSSTGSDEVDRGTDSDSGDVWERKDNSNIRSPLTDNIKSALYSDSNTDINYHNRYPTDQSNHWNHSELTNDHRDSCKSNLRDLRTLRHMLHSSDIIVKPNPSDYIEYTSSGSHLTHKLSTIDDDDEEEFVRVTTL